MTQTTRLGPWDATLQRDLRYGSISQGSGPPSPPGPPGPGEVVATPAGTISGNTNSLTTGVLDILAGDTVFVFVNARSGDTNNPSAPVITGLSATWTSFIGNSAPQVTQDPGQTPLVVYTAVGSTRGALVVYAAYFDAPVSGTINASWTVSVTGESIMNVVTVSNLAPDLSAWVNATALTGVGGSLSPSLTPVFTDDRSPCLMVAASNSAATSTWTAGYTEIFDNSSGNDALAAALSETGIANPMVTFSFAATAGAVVIQLKKAIEPSAARVTPTVVGTVTTASAAASSIALASFPVLAAGDFLMLIAFSRADNILSVSTNTTGLTFREVQRVVGVTGATSTGVRVYISNAVAGPVTGSVTIANGNTGRGMWVAGVGLRAITTRFDCQKDTLVENTPGTSFIVPAITTQAVDALDFVLAFVEDDDGVGGSDISSSLTGFTNILTFGSATQLDISFNIWAESRPSAGAQSTPSVTTGSSQECCIVRLGLEAAYA